jgi:L-ascorbate metabolism protein UlaG (beta-lactamase superfamily)
MKIKWLGHSCFKITSKRGIRIVTDPFDDNVGYRIPSVEADIVTLSHGHYDHNFVDCISGKFDVITKVGNFNVKDIPLTGIHTYHDEVQGDKRGGNIIYVFNVDEFRVAHLGDLGHTLSPAQIEMIGKVDVLLIPVGGVYTINGEHAVEVVEQLKPSIVIPMHYKTNPLKFELESVENFLGMMKDVEKIQSQVVEISKDKINDNEVKVYVLQYE